MPLFEGIHVTYSGEKTAVVLDIGAAYTKSGFAGENGPRCILPSELVRAKTGQLVKIRDVMDKDEELYDILVEFLHRIYFRHLLVNPKDRRVVICESILCQSNFRDVIARVLFKHYEVPSVLFAPSHQLVLFTLATNSGLVIDVGYTESLVLPIFEGIPVLKAWEAVPLAGRAIHENLESQLMEGTNVVTQEQGERPLSSVVSSIEENILEDMKVRCCFVTKFDRAMDIHSAKLKESGYGEGATGPEPPPGVDYPLDGEKMLHIDGKIRESACEVLFEQDNEERSVATLILDSLKKCPIDMRCYMAENIVIIGGTAMLPGFKARLRDELYSLLEKPKYQEDLAIKVFKFHQLPAKENYAAWLGGAIFGALEVLGSRSLSREQFLQTGKVPDWSSLSSDTNKEEEDRLPVPRGR